MSARWTVLVCGDAHRLDDGAAIAAGGRLEGSVPHDVVIRRVGQLCPEDVVDAVDRGRCLVVDTVRGVTPGSLVRVPLARIARPDGPASASSHALPMPTVVGIAEALGADLDGAWFIGIGGRRFGFGVGLSGPVERGLDRLAMAILATVEGAPPGDRVAVSGGSRQA
jgi:hydrogenase maturation protease